MMKTLTMIDQSNATRQATLEELRVELAKKAGWKVTVWDGYAFQILHADGRGCGGPGNAAGIVMDKAGVPDYLNSDTEMLNWLETNKAKVEPPFRNGSWIGIFWGQRDCGGNSIREAIRTAMIEDLRLSHEEDSATVKTSNQNLEG